MHKYSEKFLNEHRDINVDWPDWHDYTLEMWTEKLETLGFIDVEIQYSGFWSKGDGASFTARAIDLETWLKSQKLGNRRRKCLNMSKAGDMWAEVYRRDNYCSHPYTVAASVDANTDLFSSYNVAIESIKEMESDLNDHIRQLCSELYRDLENEYNYLTSDEAVAEALWANDIHEDVAELIADDYTAQVLRNMDQFAENGPLPAPLVPDVTRLPNISELI
jgi:hypothetical protein